MAWKNAAETSNWIDNIPNTPIELEKIWVKIVEWWEFNFEGIQYKWRKISMNGKKLDVPLFEKEWLPPLSERIITFHKKMIHGSCREQLWGLNKTCSANVEVSSSEKFIGLDDKKIVTAKDFSDFVGIQIIWSDTKYLEMRKLLAGKGEKKDKIIYPDDKTMIADVVDWWNGLPTDPLYAASWKQDTLADFGNKLKFQLEPLLVAFWKKEKTPPGEVTAIRGKKPTDPLK